MAHVDSGYRLAEDGRYIKEEEIRRAASSAAVGGAAESVSQKELDEIFLSRRL